jgi:DNA repair photolyase
MNDSDDLPFRASINPYRGCEHGCVYCYARPSHEFLGFSSGLDFETRIVVKEEAPALLRRELGSRKWTPQVVVMSGNTDCYQMIDRRLELTRRCLEVFAEFRNPVGIITKNALVTRDADLLGELASFDAASVALSITTLDTNLWRVLEPRTSNPERRLAAIEELTKAGIPTSVMVAPVIPGLNDHEVPAILEAAAKAGAKSAGYIMLRLPHSLTDLFEEWLELHFPDRKKKVLDRIRSVRGGGLNDPRFGTRMRGEGIFAQQVRQLFHISREKHGLTGETRNLSTAHFRNPEGRQLDFFE